MLTEICQYLRNWFNRKPDGDSYPKEAGTFTIENGELNTEILANGQYFRIMGSLFNDGVHKYGVDTSGESPKLYETLTDETFDGVIWSMGVPLEIVKLAEDIDAWMEKYGTVDSEAMSPFSSESFGGYSYNKQQGFASTGGGMLTTWESIFSDRLSPWRKV